VKYTKRECIGPEKRQETIYIYIIYDLNQFYFLKRLSPIARLYSDRDKGSRDTTTNQFPQQMTFLYENRIHIYI